MNFAKIVATIGPASEKEEVFSSLVKAGLSVARLNFSHGTHEEHGKRIATIRTVSKKLKKDVAILADLCGPKIRIGELPSPRILSAKSVVTFSCANHTETSIPVQYIKLAQEVKKGTTLMLDDGKLSCIVEKTDGTHITARMIVGGELKSRKGINVINGMLSVRAFTDKDKKDVLFAAKAGVDCVALSFVRSPKDILDIKAFLKKNGFNLPVIAKIETEEAIADLEEIVKVSDGIMVARGDLAIEVPTEYVPVYQNRMIDLARKYNIPCITATQMLESMTRRPTPTRAEVSDVAHAVFGGTDCVMLSEETAAGEFPVEAVGMMSRILGVSRARRPGNYNAYEWTNSDGVVKAAIELAKKIQAKAIVTLTETGNTTRRVASYRMDIPHIALTPHISTIHRLQLSYGVTPHLITSFKTLDNAITSAKEVSSKLCSLKKGDSVVLVGGMPFGKAGGTNFVYTITL